MWIRVSLIYSYCSRCFAVTRQCSQYASHLSWRDAGSRPSTSSPHFRLPTCTLDHCYGTGKSITPMPEFSLELTTKSWPTGLPRKERVATTRFLAAQFYELRSRSAAVRLGRHRPKAVVRPSREVAFGELRMHVRVRPQIGSPIR